MSESNLRAGWYVDPKDSKSSRYWDGTGWTSRTGPWSNSSGRTHPAVITTSSAQPAPAATEPPEKEQWEPPVWVTLLVIAAILAALAGGGYLFVTKVENWPVWVGGTIAVAVMIGGAISAFLNPDGEHVPQLICPHCNVKGHVYREVTTEKGGISGGKATGAILTGGTSLWFTGLSSKHEVAKLTCKNCSSEWAVRR